MTDNRKTFQYTSDWIVEHADVAENRNMFQDASDWIVEHTYVTDNRKTFQYTSDWIVEHADVTKNRLKSSSTIGLPQIVLTKCTVLPQPYH